MDEENEVFLEDVCEAVISKGFDELLANSDIKPGDSEYTEAVKAITELYAIRIKYTEIQMKYEDAEAQREHELKLKRLEYDARMKELEVERLAREAQLKGQNVAMILDVGTQIAKSVLTSVYPTFAFDRLSKMALVSEYQNNRFWNSTSWKMASSALTKQLKSGT